MVAKKVSVSMRGLVRLPGGGDKRVGLKGL